MSNPKPQPPRRRPAKNTYTTKSGTTIKLHHSLSDRIRERKDAKARRRAAYLSRMPKNRWKRILFRLKPRELARYWFSRDGAIMALKLLGISIVVLFQDYDSDKRIPVQSNQISKYMNEATVATEDRGFYTEGAFNIKGIL